MYTALLLLLMISFDDLEKAYTSDAPFVEEEVSIRGFLTEVEGGYCLSESPGLKTCCVGKPEKVSRQVFVEGLSNAPQRAVTLSGQLTLTANTAAPVFLLEEAEMEVTRIWPFLCGGMVFISLTAAFFILRRQR